MKLETVETVLGPVPVSELGPTLMHEHLLIGWPGWEKDHAVTFDRQGERDMAVDRLQELRSLGVRTFVDPCAVDMGRDVEFAAEVSQRSGMNIVAATGMYRETFGQPTHFRNMDVGTLAEFFERELTEGIGSTGIKAGIIKCATQNPISENENKVLRAAARAAKAVDARIITHTDDGARGLEQLDAFEAEGMPLHYAAIGHSDGTANLQYHDSILTRGAYLSMDRFGLEMVFPDRLRIGSLIGLLGMGWQGRLFLSHDAVGCSLGRPRVMTPEIQKLRAKWNYFHLIRDIFPILRAAGVPQERLDSVLTDNPRQFFAGGEPSPAPELNEM